jgi:hydroxyacylglutathione hydrolase
MFEVWPIPVLDDNYIWVIERSGRDRVAVVDPGDGHAALAALAERGLVPCGVLVTHHHADHVGGVGELRSRHSLPVFGPTAEPIDGVDRPLDDGDRALLPELDLELEVLAVPGHTAGHLAYLGPGFLLCGDTLFAGGCGRLFEGTPEQMHRSLQRLARLDPGTLAYCAHEYTVNNLRFAAVVEPFNSALARRLDHALALRGRGLPTVPSSIADELATNPFLRCGEPAVRSAAERFAGAALASEVEVFAALRRFKDGWRS